MRARFRYNCVNPRSSGELQYILDHAKEISYHKFILNVDSSVVFNFEHGRMPRLKDDYAVSFYESKLRNGRKVFFFVDSMIEYVFY